MSPASSTSSPHGSNKLVQPNYSLNLPALHDNLVNTLRRIQNSTNEFDYLLKNAKNPDLARIEIAPKQTRLSRFINPQGTKHVTRERGYLAALINYHLEVNKSPARTAKFQPIAALPSADLKATRAALAALDRAIGL
jgi:hypothetical protein